MSLRRAAALALAALSVAACDARSEAPSFQGYVEADPVFVAPEEAGRLVALAVEEGERVAEGGAVFALDTELEEAELAEARAQLAEARATPHSDGLAPALCRRVARSGGTGSFVPATHIARCIPSTARVMGLSR